MTRWGESVPGRCDEWRPRAPVKAPDCSAGVDGDTKFGGVSAGDRSETNAGGVSRGESGGGARGV